MRAHRVKKPSACGGSLPDRCPRRRRPRGPACSARAPRRNRPNVPRRSWWHSPPPRPGNSRRCRGQRPNLQRRCSRHWCASRGRSTTQLVRLLACAGVRPGPAGLQVAEVQLPSGGTGRTGAIAVERGIVGHLHGQRAAGGGALDVHNVAGQELRRRGQLRQVGAVWLPPLLQDAGAQSGAFQDGRGGPEPVSAGHPEAVRAGQGRARLQHGGQGAAGGVAGKDDAAVPDAAVRVAIAHAGVDGHALSAGGVARIAGVGHVEDAAKSATHSEAGRVDRDGRPEGCGRVAGQGAGAGEDRKVATGLGKRIAGVC